MRNQEREKCRKIVIVGKQEGKKKGGRKARKERRAVSEKGKED